MDPSKTLGEKNRQLLHKITYEGPKSVMEETSHSKTDLWDSCSSINLGQATEDTVWW